MMRNYDDLIGKTVGSLLVVKFFKQKRGRTYVSMCKLVCPVCGTHRIVADYRLFVGDFLVCLSCKRFSDLTGKVFGYWLVVERSQQRRWKCQCLKCGCIKELNKQELETGKTSQCRDCFVRSITTHGLSGTSVYDKIRILVRREHEKVLDTQWTIEMEKLLCDLQTKCIICNSTDRLATDHVLPLSKGYGLKPGNAVRLCKSCNSKKYNKTLNDLPEIWQHRLTMAAESFRCEWESYNE